MRFIAALIAQALSYLTTLGAAAFFVQPGQDLRRWGAAIGVAIAFEALFFGMKESMFQPGGLNKVIGAIGFLADGVINAGGIMAIALGILTFGPIALILGVAEVDISSPDAILLASAGLSLVLGLVLSLLPHGLWRQTTGRRAAARAA